MSFPGGNPEFDRAVRLHRTGQVAQAIPLYREVLARQPDHAEAAYLLGSAELQLGHADEGIRALERSIRSEPRQPETLFDLGLALHRAKRYDEALHAYDRALAQEPNFAACCNNRGNTLRRLKRFDEARQAFDRALALKPDYADALCNRGGLLLDLQRPAEALADLDRAIALAPRLRHAHNLRGNALAALQRTEEALSAYDRAIALKADYAEAHCNRGYVLVALNRAIEALIACDRALMLKPDYASAWNIRGVALKNLERFDEARQCFDRAIALDPENAAAYSNRGSVVRELHQPQAALADQNRALALDGENASAYNNRGNVYSDLWRLDEALADLDRAIALDPNRTGAWSNRGNVLKDLRRLPESLASFDRALALDPGNPEALWNKSLVALLQGNFAEGWRLHEYRWTGSALRRRVRKFSQPLWLGEPAAGRTVLLYAEQGFGDTLQFCRYAPLVQRGGARVVLEVPSALKTLLSSLSGVDVLAAAGEPLPDFDLQCPLMSLPLAFRTDLSNLPAEVPYLTADPVLCATWRQRLGEKCAPRIGLCWSGKPGLRPDLTRSMPLRHLLALVAQPYEWHCLQLDIRDSDRAALTQAARIKTHTDELSDFADTAALIAEMDLVISVDTSIAHLAGALGKPVWILLPWAGEWRWLEDRDDSPWYPTARLFRQPTAGDWDSLVATVAARLAAEN